jgi:hypothetical protein
MRSEDVQHHWLGFWDCAFLARVSQSSASLSHAALSCGLVARAANWRHSSASRRNLSESESAIAAEYAQSPTDDTSPKVESDKAPLLCQRLGLVSQLSNWKPIATNAESNRRCGKAHNLGKRT